MRKIEWLLCDCERKVDTPKSAGSEHSIDWLSVLSAVIGGVGGIIIGICRIYQIAQHPEWTEAQALLNLYPFYALGGGLVLFASGWIWRDSFVGRGIKQRRHL